MSQHKMLSLAAKRIKFSTCLACRVLTIWSCKYSQDLETKYSDTQKEQIVQVINDNDTEALSRYNITKLKSKKITEWVQKHGRIKSISDIELIDGFTEKYTKKLCDNILQGPQSKEPNLSRKIKGQVLHPTMTEVVRKNCKTVLAVYITANSVCWTFIDRNNYEVLEWRYKTIQYTGSKSIKITEIMDIAWQITNELPIADVYVMKAEATSLRATGSDPNNPKVIGVNLQKAQMISMIVAFINARANEFSKSQEEDQNTERKLTHNVYFLRPTLPYRLYGTLVGNEKVSTDQVVEMLLQETRDSKDTSQVYVPEHLKNMFRSQKDLKQDMLGHCFLLAITFMDICVFRNKESIEKLIKRGE